MERAQFALAKAKGQLYRRFVRANRAAKNHQPWRFVRGLLHPVRRFIRRHLNPLGIVAIDVQGFLMFVETRDVHVTPSLALDGVWEPHVTRLLADTLKPGMTFVDAGANIGYYTLLASRAVGPTGRVIAFEPDPGNFALLQRNVEVNACSNVILVSKALSSEKGQLHLYLAADDLGDHSVLAQSERQQAVDIETVRLDEFCAAHGHRVDVVKIDTQGSEPAILQGMNGLTGSANPPRIICEYCPTRLRRYHLDPRSIPDALTAMGYAFQVISPTEARLEPLDIERAATMSAEHFVEMDLLCTKVTS